MLRRRRARRSGAAPAATGGRRESRSPDTRLPASLRATLGLPLSGGGAPRKFPSRGNSPRSKRSRKRARATESPTGVSPRSKRQPPAELETPVAIPVEMSAEQDAASPQQDRPVSRLPRRKRWGTPTSIVQDPNSSSEDDNSRSPSALARLSKLSKRKQSAVSNASAAVADDASDEDPDKKETKRLEKLLGIAKKRRSFTTKGKRFSYSSLFGEADKELAELADFCDNRTGPTEESDSDEPSQLESKLELSIADDPANDLPEETVPTDESACDPDETTDEDVSSRQTESIAELIEKKEDDEDTSQSDAISPPKKRRAMQTSYIPPSKRGVEAVGAAESSGNLAGAYVPPSKRGNGADLGRTGRRIRGLLNRLADANAGGIASSLEPILRKPDGGASRADVLRLYVDGALDAVRDGSATLVLSPFVMPHAAVAAHLGASVDMRVLASLLSNAVRRMCSGLSNLGASEIDDEDTILVESATPRRPLFGYVALIGALYQVRAISGAVVHDVVRTVADGEEKERVELLLLLFRQIGSQIRKEDPTSLKDMIEFLRNRFEESRYHPVNGTKIGVMLDLITDVKNNKLKARDTAELQSRFAWAAKVDTPLSAGVAELCDDEFTGRRWWEQGAEMKAENESTANVATLKVEDGEVDLSALAISLRLNTDYRRALFGAIMSSASVTDAFARVERLGGLTKGKDGDSARVVLHCCAAEKGYNPFYALLAVRMCEHSRTVRFAFEHAVADLLCVVDGGGRKVSRRRVGNYAQFVAELLSKRALTVAVFRRALSDGNQQTEIDRAMATQTFARLARCVRHAAVSENKTVSEVVDGLFAKLSKTELEIAGTVSSFIAQNVVHVTSEANKPIVGLVAKRLAKSNGLAMSTGEDFFVDVLG